MKANFTLTRPERPMSPLAVYGPAIIPVVIAFLLNMPKIGFLTGDWSPYLRVFLNDGTLLNLTSLLYLFSSICFGLYLFQKEATGRVQKEDAFNEKFMQLGTWLAIAGFTFHSTSFILRWVDVKRPPIGGINEVVLSFAWTLVLLNLIISHASKFRFMNFITMPFATVAALLATIFPTGRDVHLVPALQSYWIYIHVTMAAFAYPTFGLSFLLGILYLIKDRVSPKSMGLGIMALTVLILGVFDYGALITSASYSVPAFANGQTIHIDKDHIMRIGIPGVGPLLSAALASAFVSLIAYSLAVAKKANTGSLAFLMARVSLLFQVVGTAVLLNQISTTPRTSVSGIPFELTGLSLTILSAAFLWLITVKQETVIKLLPDLDKLDTLIYRVITIGFPLLAGQLITGAMWAGESWGRYWGWDPKETWALITWLIYAAYLHTRMTRGWTGRKNVAFALVGFASVMFTYLGVTYLLSGLHSYK